MLGHLRMFILLCKLLTQICNQNIFALTSCRVYANHVFIMLEQHCFHNFKAINIDPCKAITYWETIVFIVPKQSHIRKPVFLLFQSNCAFGNRKC